MKSIIISTLLLLVLASCRDDANPTSPKDDTHIIKGSIKGYVYDATTELPVSGVIVSTFPITSSTRTDANGKFELPEVSPDLYDLNISHKDYFAYTSKIKVSDQITNDIELFITSLESVNNRPDKPKLLLPADKISIGSGVFKFKWECNDIDNDSLKYDVFFRSIGSDFKLVANNIKTKYFNFEYKLNETDKYQWYVVAKDNYSFSISDTFSFTYKEIVITDIPDLIGNWRFDGDATDYGPNGYVSNIQNVLFVADRNNSIEHAANFTGKSSVSSKILLPTSLQLTSEFTIALWVKPAATLGDNGSVGNFECVSKWGGAGAGKASWAFGITKESYLFLATYGSAATIKPTVNFQIKPEVWQHIAVTFSNGVATFYIDGSQVFEATGMQIPQVSGYNASIGGRQDQMSSYNGAIDDLFLFERALTSLEIQRLSQQ